ncbi:monovalent cation/H(+) antiporter subunit G [Nocardiopsis metallicus]|uniref:Multicomponent Na+:H+ antiporter subunit G n=1 Tax=Nocardiopsis metallicus TaxID=179819 RepID=A0A840WMR0_9ACTN|nr:monovalent cation/H(+) antiporter subunit G [Nocardiopsis metallicus]MBB5494281.1 multicomponent Na+:H+ antiporter subunit G [Nocardiopsis metallicus]
MNDVMESVGDTVMFVGALVFLVSAIGMLRLPDVYSRLSALTIAGSLSTGLVIIGLFLHQPSLGNALKLGLALLIQLVTTAVGGSAMARAGYLIGAPRNERTLFDDLAVEGDHGGGDSRHPGYSRPSEGESGPENRT